jgi:hypothetical protein
MAAASGRVNGALLQDQRREWSGILDGGGAGDSPQGWFHQKSTGTPYQE